MNSEFSIRARAFVILLLCIVQVVHLSACAPTSGLTFPTELHRIEDNIVWYDVDRSGRGDFALFYDADGRVKSIGYDDDHDDECDRLYRLDSGLNAGEPHLIILLDSIPFQAVESYYAAGHLRWFDAPQKVIPPFPTMSGVIFSQILGAPPLPGMINRHYDSRTGKMKNMIVDRAMGRINPWQQRLHYRAKYSENGLAFLQPRSWYAAELHRVRDALDASPDRTTIVYIASSSGMLSRFGQDGLEEVLQGLEQLTLQLLYERRGAISISVLADHGHNLMVGERISLDDTLTEAGFHVTNRVRDVHDVVVEMDGMVNYIGIHTQRPAAVADALLTRHEVQLAMYQDRERIIVRDMRGAAAIECRDDRLRYSSLSADVLDYEQVIGNLESKGRVDDEGFIADADWFAATCDHEWPDGPRRLWDAFHGTAISTPALMLTLQDGYCTGLGFLDLFIDMASTHGGLNQVNSASFVMTTNGRAIAPMRSRDVLRCIEPDYFRMSGR